MNALPPELRARILDAARNEPSKTRAETQRLVALLVAGGFTVLFGIVMLTGGVVAGDRPATYFLVSAVGWIVMAIVSTWGALSRGRSLTGRSSSFLITLAVLTAPLFAAWIYASSMGWPQTGHMGCPPELDRACLLFTLVMAIAPFGGFFVARRGTVPVNARWTGAALGAASGAWGAVSIHAHCPCTDMSHMIIGHVVPIVVMTGLGAALGPSVLGLSSSAQRKKTG